MTSPNGDQTHYVYRLFDEDDCCLYVGLTVNVDGRIQTHHHLGTPFAHLIARTEVTEHPNLTAARAVEAAEILRLRPRWNVSGRRRRVEWTACDYFEVIERISLYPARQMPRHRLAKLVLEYRRRFPEIAEQTLPALALERAA